MPAVKSTDRFLRVHKKSKYEEDDDGDDAQEDRMFEWLTGQVSAVTTLLKILGTKPEKMADVIMSLSKREVDDLFQHGQTTLANILPGYLIIMEPNDFANLVKASMKLDDHHNDMLIFGY